MITTVTTTTTTTVTTISAVSLALIAILTLLSLLISKEIISSSSSERARRLSRSLNIAIVPLVLVFFATAIAQIIKVLS
ncbi:MAG TPA: hypothetical protein VH186_06990 [Chloroflexia bacterium]|nr:hypothetical protein [Chloroflexia bacterium]